jgi:hypothetical protein
MPASFNSALSQPAIIVLVAAYTLPRVEINKLDIIVSALLRRSLEISINNGIQ